MSGSAPFKFLPPSDYHSLFLFFLYTADGSWLKKSSLRIATCCRVNLIWLIFGNGKKENLRRYLKG